MKTILVDAAHCFAIRGEGIVREMYALLEQYPNRKIVLTNADDDGIKALGLDKSPYPVFTLRRDPEKTDPHYYDILFERFGLEPKDAVYIEHKKTVVELARQRGIATYHYDEDEMDLEKLKGFLDENLAPRT